MYVLETEFSVEVYFSLWFASESFCIAPPRLSHHDCFDYKDFNIENYNCSTKIPTKEIDSQTNTRISYAI